MLEIRSIDELPVGEYTLFDATIKDREWLHEQGVKWSSGRSLLLPETLHRKDLFVVKGQNGYVYTTFTDYPETHISRYPAIKLIKEPPLTQYDVFMMFLEKNDIKEQFFSSTRDEVVLEELFKSEGSDGWLMSSIHWSQNPEVRWGNYYREYCKLYRKLNISKLERV